MRNLLISLLKPLTIASVVAGGPSVASAAASDSAEWEDAGDPRNLSRDQRISGAALPHSLSDSDVQSIMQFAELGAQSDPIACGAVLAELLSGLEGLDRVYLICELATSTHQNCRLALAHALSEGLMAVGVPRALVTLASDEDPRVRSAALHTLELLQRQGHLSK